MNECDKTDGIYTEFSYYWSADCVESYERSFYKNKLDFGDSNEIEDIVRKTITNYPEIKLDYVGYYADRDINCDECIIYEDEGEGFDLDGGGSEWEEHGFKIKINLDKKYKRL